MTTYNFDASVDGKEIFDQLKGDTTIKGKALTALSRYNEGSQSFALLTLAGAIVATETFTLGEDVYEITQVNTDTTVNVSGTMSAGTPKLVASGAFPAQVVKGSILRIENEFVRVLELASTTEALVQRGFGGSTAASHADTTDIFRAATATTAGRFAIPVGGTLTAAAAEPLIIAAVNFWSTVGEKEGAGAGTGVVRTNRLPVTAVALGGADGVYFVAPGAAGTASTETFTNGSFRLATFEPEQKVAMARMSVVKRAVVAGDAGVVIRIVLPFTPVAGHAELYSSAGVKVAEGATAPTLAFDGKVAVVTAGSTAFAAAQTLVVTAVG